MNFDDSKDGEIGIQMGDQGSTLLRETAKAEILEDGEEEAPMTVWQSFKKSFFNAAKMDDIGGVGVDDLNEKGLALPLLLLYGSMWFGCPVYFSVTGSLENLTKKYLGLELIVDQSQICKEVPMVPRRLSRSHALSTVFIVDGVRDCAPSSSLCSLSLFEDDLCCLRTAGLLQ
jgi:hypothetical protein